MICQRHRDRVTTREGETMGNHRVLRRAVFATLSMWAAALLSAGLLERSAQAVDVSVVGVNTDGSTSVVPGGYRWVLEEDDTYHVNPGSPIRARSWWELHAGGRQGRRGDALPALDPSKHYFLRFSRRCWGHTIGGA
jgi:hypothetical protein